MLNKIILHKAQDAADVAKEMEAKSRKEKCGW